MICPRCESPTLHELDRDGVTIDRCERCRGVWLDRGELEKLVARAGAAEADDDASYDGPRNGARRRDDSDDDHDRHRGSRKKSWWEIFD